MIPMATRLGVDACSFTECGPDEACVISREGYAECVPIPRRIDHADPFYDGGGPDLQELAVLLRNRPDMCRDYWRYLSSQQKAYLRSVGVECLGQDLMQMLPWIILIGGAALVLTMQQG